MDVKKLTASLIITLFWVLHSLGADITIKYIITKDSSRLGRNLDTMLLKIVPNSWDHIDLNNNRPIPCSITQLASDYNKEVIAITYSISRDGCYFLRELFGHELLLTSSRDTVVVYMTPILIKKKINGRTLAILNDSIVSTWLWKLTFDSNHRYIGFFDSLAYLHGDLRTNMNYTFKSMGNNINRYWETCNRNYINRNKFLSDNWQYFKMPEKLKYYAQKEIQYCFYQDLMNPVVWKSALLDSFPLAFKDSLRTFANNLNDIDLFEHISYYRADILDYLFNVQSALINIDLPDSSFLINRQLYFNKECKGEIRAYILAFLMEKCAQIGSVATFETIFSSYTPFNSSPGVTEFVDSLYKILVSPNSYPSETVLNYTFEDSAHKTSTLKEFLTKDIILIDSWATWCKPCREQQPSLDSIVAKYKDQAQFISLSADQFSYKWDNWLKFSSSRNPDILQLHATKGFENAFFRHFRINTIPRYILISKKGKIINIAMPYPSNQKEFDALLDQAISEYEY